MLIFDSGPSWHFLRLADATDIFVVDSISVMQFTVLIFVDFWTFGDACFRSCFNASLQVSCTSCMYSHLLLYTHTFVSSRKRTECTLSIEISRRDSQRSSSHEMMCLVIADRFVNSHFYFRPLRVHGDRFDRSRFVAASSNRWNRARFSCRVFIKLERMARDVINDAADIGECQCGDII